MTGARCRASCGHQTERVRLSLSPSMGGAVRLRRTDVRNGSDYCRASIVFTVRLRRNTQSTRRSSATSTPRRGSPMSSPEYPITRCCGSTSCCRGTGKPRATAKLRSRPPDPNSCRQRVPPTVQPGNFPTYPAAFAGCLRLIGLWPKPRSTWLAGGSRSGIACAPPPPEVGR